MSYTKLKDLKKGDTVYFSVYGNKSEEAIIKKVRIVDKAALITIEPIGDNSYGTFFTGYYTSDTALGRDDSVIKTNNWQLDYIKRNMERTSECDFDLYKASKVLAAVMEIKNYLLGKED